MILFRFITGANLLGELEYLENKNFTLSVRNKSPRNRRKKFQKKLLCVFVPQLMQITFKIYQFKIELFKKIN